MKTLSFARPHVVSDLYELTVLVTIDKKLSKYNLPLYIYTHLKDYEEHHTNTVFDPLSP